MKNLRILLVPIMLAIIPFTSWADPGKDGREYKEEYWEGNCKVKRKQDKNGEYEEERKCRAPRRGYIAERREYQEEYWEGDCKVKRKQDKNGEYEEERKCRAPRYGHYGHEPVYVPAPAVVREPGIRVDGTVTIGR